MAATIVTTPAAERAVDHLRISDLRGIAQLATQATVGVTGIVEGVHRSVWSTMGVPGGNVPGRARGITGLVFRSIRGITRLVGAGVDLSLAGLQSRFESARDSTAGAPMRDAVLAVLNGVIGDRLVAGDNPLATPMTLRYRGEALCWRALPPMPEATGKVLLLIHGLCMNDLQWHVQRQGCGVGHGEVLASALGYTPVYLRYNSGLQTSWNGRQLSAQLEQLVMHWPTPIEELTVVAHSMGGLLIRSACRGARANGLRWPGKLKSMVFLGTPHHGAPLERAGGWVDRVLASTPYTAPFAKLGQLRSIGITDLRYGSVASDDGHGHERSHRDPGGRRFVPLPDGVSCYAMAATTAARRSALANRLFGDGLVPLESALGQHNDPQHDLGFAESSRWIGYRMNHMELLSSPEVGRQMIQWLTQQPVVKLPPRCEHAFPAE